MNTITIINPREIPAEARNFVALDREGRPFPGIEIDGRRYDRDAWIYRSDNEMPEDYMERPS